jgi:hypothetical protein
MKLTTEDTEEETTSHKKAQEAQKGKRQSRQPRGSILCLFVADVF